MDAAWAGPLPRIVITGFEPFAGRATNQSWDTAQELKQLLETRGIAEASLCLLPVVFDKAAELARQCIGRNTPLFVISLGEGGCQFRLETAAHNLDSTGGLPDNAGQLRFRTPIDPEGPQSVAFRFPVDELYCAIPRQELSQFAVSASPGQYVCNNTAYHLSRDLKAAGIPYTFIHVMPQYCKTGSLPSEQAATLLPLFRQAIRSAESGSLASAAMPGNPQEARQALKRTESSGDECRREFYQKLLSEMQ